MKQSAYAHQPIDTNVTYGVFKANSAKFPERKVNTGTPASASAVASTSLSFITEIFSSIAVCFYEKSEGMNSLTFASWRMDIRRN
jgi:hypothetical protein